MDSVFPEDVLFVNPKTRAAKNFLALSGEAPSKAHSPPASAAAPQALVCEGFVAEETAKLPLGVFACEDCLGGLILISMKHSCDFDGIFDHCQTSKYGDLAFLRALVVKLLGLITLQGFLMVASSSVASDAPESRNELEIFLERGRDALTRGAVDEAKDLMAQAKAKFDGLTDEAQGQEPYLRLRAQMLVLLGTALVVEVEDENDLAPIVKAHGAFLGACSIFEALRKVNPEEPKLAIESAECHLHAAELYESFDDTESKTKFQRQALNILQTALRSHPQDVYVKRHLANAILTEGAKKNMGELTERRQQIQQAVDLLQGLVEENSDDLELKSELGRALPLLGFVIGGSEDVAMARAVFKQNIELWDELAARLPDNDEVIQRKAGARTGLAGLERDEKNFEVSMKLHQEARAIRTQMSERDPTNLDLKYEVVNDLHVMGVVAMQADDTKTARQYYGEALIGYEKLASEYPGETESEEQIVLVHRLLGDMASEDDQWPEALAAYRASLTRAEEDSDFSEGYMIREVVRLWRHVAEQAGIHGDTVFLREAHARMIDLLEMNFSIANGDAKAYDLLIQGCLDAADFAGKQKQREDQTRSLARAVILFDQLRDKGVKLDDEELEQAVEAGRRLLEGLRTPQ